MKIAVLSDIHSNQYALQAVLSDIKKLGIERVIVLGDTFGYYPWAVNTFKLLEPYLGSMLAVKGNHDQLVLDQSNPTPAPSYWPVAKMNEMELKRDAPEAIEWLKNLQFDLNTELAGKKLRLVHGTPENPSDGRFYPDNNKDMEWMPAKNEILMMGHTHYPLSRKSLRGGMMYNPGSVGQPRDSNPMPAWATFDDQTNEFVCCRSQYDNISVMKELKAMNWDDSFIESLNKNPK
jgi:putative phosphoesterase